MKKEKVLAIYTISTIQGASVFPQQRTYLLLSTLFHFNKTLKTQQNFNSPKFPLTFLPSSVT